MINKIEIIRDTSIILDMIFTMFAVAFQNKGNNSLSGIFFGISGFGLVLASICVIITLINKFKNKQN